MRGVDDEILATLRPFISAVPYYLPINVNTASPVLLAALVEGATGEQMQALTGNRGQQVLASINDLWQLPLLSALSAEQQQPITPLIAVDSSAFMALITATDSTGKQRFATVLISNRLNDNVDGDANNNSNENTNNTESNSANNNANNIANDGENDKEVKVVSQRLWAFRPSFQNLLR